MSNRFLALAAATALASTATAQFCSDNTYPIHIVDAAGTELATTFDPAANENTFLVETEEVFLAFDPNLPTGTYYVHVTDTPINGMDEVVSQNDPMDRFVHVDNNNGVITLSLPFSSNPSAAVFGTGLNGVGQSLQLNPFTASQYSQCNFKVWYGDSWNLSNGPANPYLLAGGLDPNTGACRVRSYHSFRVGDGNGSDLSGNLFVDADRNGVRDAGEVGLEGQQVVLSNGAGVVATATTDADGNYTFADVGKDDFTVELTVPSGYVATTAASHQVEVCNCASVEAPSFGVDLEVMPCNAKSLCYWRRNAGACEAVQAGVLPTLPALCIVNTWGCYVAPCNKRGFKRYLRRANCWNMGYALSAQLVAMHSNLMSGRVHPSCVICDPCLGVMTIQELINLSVAQLCANPYTPPCSGPARWEQAKLRNALWRANKNRIWQ